MSVLIKGIDAPHDCYDCDFAYTLDGDWHCSLLHDGRVESLIDKRADDCPMIEIPSGHGDLIDRSKIAFDYWSVDNYAFVGKRNIFEMPVIVPAEKEGK